LPAVSEARDSIDRPGSTCENPLPANSKALNLISITFTDTLHGWLAGTPGTILYTADGGQDWTATASGTALAFRSISFATLQDGWAVRNAGTIMQTNDGGQSWKPKEFPQQPWLRQIAF
jgi:hypothetical protein